MSEEAADQLRMTPQPVQRPPGSPRSSPTSALSSPAPAEPGSRRAGRRYAPRRAAIGTPTRRYRPRSCLLWPPFFQGGDGLGLPLRHGRFVPLARAPGRLLQGPAQAGQQPADVRGVVLDPKLAPDHGRHPLAGPPLADEPPSFGPAAQQFRDARLLR